MAIWQNMGTMQNMVALHQLLTMQGREVIMELPHHPQPLAKSQLLTHMGLIMVSRVQNMQCLIGVNMHKHRVHMGRLIHGMTLPEGIRMHMLQQLLPNKDSSSSSSSNNNNNSFSFRNSKRSRLSFSDSSKLFRHNCKHP